MEFGTLLSVCGTICFLGTVLGAIVAVVVLIKRKYGDEDDVGENGPQKADCPAPACVCVTSLLRDIPCMTVRTVV